MDAEQIKAKIKRLEKTLARCGDAYLKRVCRAEITALYQQLKELS